MAFILLSTGHLLEVAETRTQVVGALANPTATGTVKGAQMTIRSSAVVAVADAFDQLDMAYYGVFDTTGT